MGEVPRVLVAVVERHADEAAFLWEQRERIARSLLFDLPQLTAFDERLEANLEGLVLASAVGLQRCVSAFERASQSASQPGGELFAAAYVAAELHENVALSRLIMHAEQHPARERTVVSALAWLRERTAERVLSDLLSEACPPALHRLGIAAAEERRRDPGAPLERALRAVDARLRASACRAAGHLGRRDLLPVLRLVAREPEAVASGWARWARGILGDPGGVDLLWDTAAGSGEVALACADLAARVSDPERAAEKLAELAASDQTLPAALAGAVARGDPAAVPWVLDVIEHKPWLGSRAAAVYVTILGAPLEPPLFERRTRPERDGRMDPDPIGGEPAPPALHDDLPRPAIEAVRAHWDTVRDRFVRGQRYLGGHPIEPAWLGEILRSGPQAWRESAAIELYYSSGGPRLFPVRAPGHDQATLLAREAR